MKVTLLRDIPKLGRKGEEKEVSNGYARNYLLSRNLAVQAGTNSARAVEEDIILSVKQKEKQATEQSRLFDKLQGSVVEIYHPANKQGHLFAAVSPQEIVKIFKKALHISIDPDKIEIRESLKSIGEHKVFYKLDKKLVEFRVSVKST